MRRIVVSLLAGAMLLVPIAASAATWDIDAGHSAVSFKVRHFFSKVPGNFNAFSGTIEFDPDHPEKSSVEVVIDVNSVDTNHEKRDSHLLAEDFFYAEKHPEMTFKSTKWKKTGDGMFDVEGTLMMRGVEKPVMLAVEFMGAGPDAWGGTRAGFAVTTTIDRKEWGINWNNTLDQGGAVLGDDVAVTIDIEATLHQEEAGE